MHHAWQLGDAIYELESKNTQRWRSESQNALVEEDQKISWKLASSPSVMTWYLWIHVYTPVAAQLQCFAISVLVRFATREFQQRAVRQTPTFQAQTIS